MIEALRAADPSSELEQVVDIMIGLTRLSRLDGAVVAGSGSVDLHLALLRRGFVRVTTAATPRLARRHYGAGLIVSGDTLTALDQASAFLSANAAIAVLVESRDGEFCMKVRKRLQQTGFRIEAGVRCQRGLVLSASRHGYVRIEAAA
jgi:hypothetical protein